MDEGRFALLKGSVDDFVAQNQECSFVEIIADPGYDKSEFIPCEWLFVIRGIKSGKPAEKELLYYSATDEEANQGVYPPRKGFESVELGFYQKYGDYCEAIIKAFPQIHLHHERQHYLEGIHRAKRAYKPVDQRE
ncbi:MAG: hypothetical protein ABII01_02130 [Candidatus Woesearchaeota archaeon]